MTAPSPLAEPLTAIRATIARVIAFGKTPDGIAARQAAEAKQRQIDYNRRARRFAESGVPAMHAAHPIPESWLEPADHRGIDSFQQESVFRRITFERHPGEMLLLTGKRGIGKTQICVWMLKREIFGDGPAAYVRALELVSDLEGSYGKPTYRDMCKKWTNPDPLVIDAMQNLKTQGPNVWLIDLLDRRYSAVRSTVLVTNIDPRSASVSVGDDILRRLNERGGMIECQFHSEEP